MEFYFLVSFSIDSIGGVSCSYFGVCSKKHMELLKKSCDLNHLVVVYKIRDNVFCVFEFRRD